MSKNRIVISATYRGEDGPHGYTNGNTYTAYLYSMANCMMVLYPYETAIDKNMCGYDNFAHFLDNWSEVTKIQ